MAGTAAVIVLWLEVVRPLAASYACRQGDLLLAGNARQALRHYEQAIALQPSDDRYWVQMAAALGQLASQMAVPAEQARLLAQAQEALRQATSLVPADAYHQANLARVQTEQARYHYGPAETALAEWECALSMDPLNAWFLAEAAHTAVILGDDQRLHAWADRALELYPNFAPPLAHLGTGVLRAGRFAEAADRLNRALHLDWHEDFEGSDHARATLAAAYLGLHDFAQARQHAGEVVRRHPEWPVAHFLLGQALEGQRLFADGAAQYRQALKLNPNYVPAKAALQQLQPHLSPP
jgi:tetratricopeptide (TPR) repeat protein